MAFVLFSLLAGVLVAAALLLLVTKPRVQPGQVTRIILLRSPNQIKAIDIALLVLQAVLKQIPGYSPSLVPGKTGTQDFDLPSIRAEGSLRINEEDVATFLRALDLPSEDPATITKDEQMTINPLFLVSQTVPLVIALIASRTCPIKPLGAVNTRNVIRLLDPVFCRNAEALRSAAAADELSYGASLETTGVRQKRGVEFCVKIEVFTSRDVIMRQSCFFLQFLPRSTEPKWNGVDDASEGKVTETPLESETIPLVLRTEDTWKWADSSKDWNPIHISSIGAKLFGFSNVIA